MRPRSLESIREELERIDRGIVLLIAARVEAACAAIQIRRERGDEITHRAQEDRVLARARSWAVEIGVSPDLAESVFRSIVEEGKRRFSTSTPGLISPTVVRERRRASASKAGGIPASTSPEKVLPVPKPLVRATAVSGDARPRG